jgi:nicotinamide-nucleotide amidase
VSSAAGTRAIALDLAGDRDGIRRRTVAEAVAALAAELGITTV